MPVARQEYFVIPQVGLLIPKMPGWTEDTSIVPPAQSDQDGIVLRLVRESAVPGSPRVDVVLDRIRDGDPKLEDFLAKNMAEMGQMEADHKIRIVNVDQRPLFLASHPVYRVHHEYSAIGSVSQVSFNQVSLFLILGHRGVAITAGGRTELFHPLSRSIETLLEGVRVQDEPGGLHEHATTHTQPIDLGRIGGKPEH